MTCWLASEEKNLATLRAMIGLTPAVAAALLRRVP